MAKKKQQFVLTGGGHRESDGTSYTRGEVVESDRDLVALFPNKFAPVGTSEAAVAQARAKEKAGVKEEADDKAGDDITKDFAKADACGVVVRRDGRKYQVYDATDGELLNDEPLTKKSDVTDFIDVLLADEG